MEENPGYYAIIPSHVRYDSNITANAKLLYGEISALCNAKGFCWASNRYFAELYGVSTGTVSGWIRQLEDAGHITCKVLRDTRKAVIGRYMSITAHLPAFSDIPSPEKQTYPSPEKRENNTTRGNNTRLKKETKEKDELEKVVSEYTDSKPLIEAINAFIAHRSEIKKPMTVRALKMILSQLDSIGTTELERIHALERSIMNRWTGVYKDTSFNAGKANVLHDAPVIYDDEYLAFMAKLNGDA